MSATGQVQPPRHIVTERVRQEQTALRKMLFLGEFKEKLGPQPSTLAELEEMYKRGDTWIRQEGL